MSTGRLSPSLSPGVFPGPIPAPESPLGRLGSASHGRRFV